MFKGIRDMMSMMKNVGQLTAQMQEMERELRGKTATGTAGGGMVTITINGLMEVQSCEIEPIVLEQENARQFLQGLVVAATNAAIMQAKSLHAQSLQNMTGGLDLSQVSGMLGDILPETTLPDDDEENR